jgi:hypothetical protein
VNSGRWNRKASPEYFDGCVHCLRLYNPVNKDPDEAEVAEIKAKAAYHKMQETIYTQIRLQWMGEGNNLQAQILPCDLQPLHVRMQDIETQGTANGDQGKARYIHTHLPVMLVNMGPDFVLPECKVYTMGFSLHSNLNGQGIHQQPPLTD